VHEVFMNLFSKKVGLIILLIFYTILIGCSRKESVLRIPLITLPITYDFTLMRDIHSGLANYNIFEPIINRTNERDYPLLAETWFVENDSILTVRLIENIRFSDGSFVTDEDIMLSLNRAFTHPNSIINNYPGIVSFSLRDNRILNVYYEDNSSLITSFLSRVAIFKAEYLRKNDDEFLRYNPLSTGAYYLYSRSDDLVVLKKNRYHRDFRRNRLSPDVVKLILEPSLENQYQMLLNNEVDFIRELPFNAFNAILNDNNFRTFSRKGNGFTFMMLDTTRDDTPGINLDVNPLKDRRVRHAIAHALDMNSYINNHMYGKASTIAIPAMSQLLGYPDHLVFYPYDVEKSKQLLSQAGFADGFEFRISFSGRSEDIAFTSFIRESLEKINIIVTFELFDIADFHTVLRANPPSAFITRVIYRNELDSILAPLSVNFFITDRPMGYNIMRNNFPQIVDLMNHMYTLNILDSRLPEYLRRLADYVYEEAMVIPFFQPDEVSAMNTNFEYVHSSVIRFCKFQRRRR